MTFMYLAQEESDDAVPQIGLEILAPTQYSIEGTYKSDYTAGQKYFINCQAGAKHSYFIFPSKAEQGWSEVLFEEFLFVRSISSNHLLKFCLQSL